MNTENTLTPESKPDKDLQAQIKALEDRLKPDSLAKLIDNSYLSINSLRIFLQILSCIMTVFLAGIAVFGYLGVKNILDLRDQVTEINSTRSSISNALNSIYAQQSDLTSGVARTIMAMNDDTSYAISTLSARVSLTISNLKSSYVAELSDLNRRTTLNSEMALKAKELAEGIFKDKIIEVFPANDFSRHSVVIDNYGQARVIFALKHTPLSGSINFSRDGAQVGGVTYFISKNNLVVAQWPNSIKADTYKANYFIAAYIPDPSAESTSLLSFDVDGKVIIEGLPDDSPIRGWEIAP